MAEEIQKFQLFKHPSRLKKRLRKGRGVSAGKGHKCGRGQTGQKSRSGGSIHARFEGGQTPLVRHLPKLDGFTVKKNYETAVFNLDAFADFPAGSEVNLSTLMERGWIKGAAKYRVKILGGGELGGALHFKAHSFSKTAREKIEKAGGTCEVVE